MPETGWQRLIEDKIGDLERKVDILMTWRAWVLGVATPAAFLCGAFSKQLLRLLGVQV